MNECKNHTYKVVQKSYPPSLLKFRARNGAQSESKPKTNKMKSYLKGTVNACACTLCVQCVHMCFASMYVYMYVVNHVHVCVFPTTAPLG